MTAPLPVPSTSSIFEFPPNFPNGQVADTWLDYFQGVNDAINSSPAISGGVTPGDLANALNPAYGAGMVGYGSGLAYAAGTVGKGLTDFAASIVGLASATTAVQTNLTNYEALLAGNTGSGQVGYLASYTGAVATTTRKMLDQVGPNLNPSVITAPGGMALAVGSAGSLTGTYNYVVTFYTAAGTETEASGEVGPVTVTAQMVNITGISVSSDPLVIGRKIYRSFPGAKDPTIKKLVTTIADNTTTTYTDNVADGSLGAFCPRINSTGSNGYVGGVRGFTYGPGTVAAFGWNTLPLNTGYANSAFGPNALTANTVGFRNCAFGIFSLYYNTTGARNTAYGIHSLNNNISSDDSSAFGYGAAINSTGECNSAFGSQALTINTVGKQNSAFGMSALLLNTGDGNSAFGYMAAFNNAAGVFICAFGNQAAFNNTSGNFNTAVGQSALFTNQTSSGNTAVGALALSATTGGSNVAMGFQAAASLVAGGTNVAIGTGAMFTSTASSGNVCLGNQAGYYETGSNKLFIDNVSRANEADARAKALIVGLFDAAIANQYVQINAKVGFNGATPIVKPTLNAAAVDPATTMALVNQIRAALIAYGLCQ